MKSIGKALRKEREKKGLSLEKVASQTRIHHSVLENLESDDFQRLPSPMYVKGFLKRYAEYLGLKSGPLIDEYLSTQPKDPEQVLVLKGKKIPRIRLDKFVVVGVLILVPIIILLSTFFIIRALVLRKSTPVTEPIKQVVPVSGTKLPEIEKSSLQPVASAKKISGPLKLEVSAEKDVWLEVRCNGELLFQGVLSKGSRETWRGEDKIRLRIGNAGALRLSLNDNPLGKLGKEGEVLKEVVLTQQGIEINPKFR